MPITYKVGEAPWEIQNTAPAGSFPVGKAPWEIQNTAPEQSTPSTFGTLTSPLREGIQGLKVLYGGGEQGIANKLVQDVQAGAQDIQKGNVLKGISKSAFRTAGDIAGTIFAPVGAAIGATGVGKAFDAVGESSQKTGGILDTLTGIPSSIDAITSNPIVQDFVLKHPNAGEDFGRLMNLLFARQEKGNIDPKTVIDRTYKQITSTPSALNLIRPTESQITAERQAKITKGLNEQNARLKSADKSYNNTIITRQTDVIGPDGKPTTETITPIDTFAKYNISPNIEKGSIQMGDYKNGTGELGKIKEFVSKLDNEIDTKLVNSGQTVPIDVLKQEAINRVKSNPEFKQAGTVKSNLAKIENRFEDYKSSYGDTIDVAEINNIRKVANKDWNPDTVDTSSIVGDVARDVVYNVIPDKSIQTLLQKQGELLAAKKYAQTINGTKVTGGKLGTMALRTTGAIIGSTLPKLPVVGPLIGAMGGELASRALQQSQFKSLWTEARSLIQRSNSTEQTIKAKTIPKIDDINQVNKATNKVTPASTNITSKRIIESSLPQEKSIVKKAVDKTTDLIKQMHNSKGGFVKLSDSGKVIKMIDEATKNEIYNVVKYLSQDIKTYKFNKSLESDFNRLASKYEININKPLSQIVKQFNKLLDKTKTK